MRVLIEQYRGWEIFFDTENENFYTASDIFDRQQTKRSYTSTKKYIDDYIKENNDFKPVMVQKTASYFNEINVIKLIGLRKDGAFMFEDKKGKKQQLSAYSEKEYFLVDSQNDAYFKEIEELNFERNKIDDKIKVIESKILKVGLDTIKSKYLTN